MRFITLIARNLFRRPVRTLLTATGLAVAIAAVLDLVGIAWNFERSFMSLFVGKGIDLVVVRAGISNQLSSTLDQKLGDRLRRLDGVAEVAPSLVDTVGFEEAKIASVLINGWEPRQPALPRLASPGRPRRSAPARRTSPCSAGSWR